MKPHTLETLRRATRLPMGEKDILSKTEKSRLEAIAFGLEAITSKWKVIATDWTITRIIVTYRKRRLEFSVGWRLSQLGWRPLYQDGRPSQQVGGLIACLLAQHF